MTKHQIINIKACNWNIKSSFIDNTVIKQGNCFDLSENGDGLKTTLSSRQQTNNNKKKMNGDFVKKFSYFIL